MLSRLEELREAGSEFASNQTAWSYGEGCGGSLHCGLWWVGAALPTFLTVKGKPGAWGPLELLPGSGPRGSCPTLTLAVDSNALFVPGVKLCWDCFSLTQPHLRQQATHPCSQQCILEPGHQDHGYSLATPEQAVQAGVCAATARWHLRSEAAHPSWHQSWVSACPEWLGFIALLRGSAGWMRLAVQLVWGQRGVPHLPLPKVS